MTLREFRSDILLLLEKSKISKDFRVNPRHIDYLIAQYRSINIRQQYSKTLEIDTTWLQDMGVIPTTRVKSSDDPIVPIGSVTLSMFTIPTVVQLPNNMGVYRISSPTKQITIYPISQPRFFDLVQDSLRSKFCYWFKVGQKIYSNHVTDLINPILILDNPMDGTIIDTENKKSGELQIGVQYIVKTGTILSNSVQYNSGQTFTAGSTTFTGSGTVQLLNQTRPMSADDPYPMSFTLAERIMLQMLTQEFKIEENKNGELRNDSNDQLTVLQGDKIKT